MKLNSLKFIETGDHVVLSAKCSIRYFGNDEIYFKLNKEHKNFVVQDYTPFLTSMLIPSMKLGVDMYIDGTVSEKVYLNLERIMQLVCSWDIGLKRIKVTIKGFTQESFSPKYNSSFFSGGVDSFYTFLNNRSKDIETDYLILANGYDINLQNKFLWKLTKDNIEQVSREQSVKLIEIESNVRDLIEPIVPWGYTHGGCLVALGLLLRKEVKNIYIPSTYSIDQLFNWGTHPDLDYLWSSRYTSFIHDGSDKSRLEKIRSISNNNSVLNHLRVCYVNKKGKFNCGECDKCIRTMIALKIVGNLDKSKTFPHSINLDTLSSLKIEGHSGSLFHNENLIELKKLNIEPEIQQILETKLKNVVDKKDSIFMSFAKKMWFWDYYYMRGLLYKILNRNRY